MSNDVLLALLMSLIGPLTIGKLWRGPMNNEPCGFRLMVMSQRLRTSIMDPSFQQSTVHVPIMAWGTFKEHELSLLVWENMSLAANLHIFMHPKSRGLFYQDNRYI